MTMKTLWYSAALLVLFVSIPARAAEPLPSLSEKTDSLEKIDGFVPLYWDADEGKMWMELPDRDHEILLVVSLPAGLGSNPVGLDRGQLGPTRVVRFERVGRQVFMIEPNQYFRAVSDDIEEQMAVADSFATSTRWGFPIAAQSDGKVLVDATSFFLRDAHGVAGTLDDSDQGQYSLDSSRSYFNLAQTRGFPKNTELEVSLTFTNDAPKGGLVGAVAASSDAVTIREHYSLVELPPPGFEPRGFDPRAGSFGISYYDFASPITEPIISRWISRHRLQKKDPNAAVSEPIEPIVYYLDRGTPEPIRSALLDGARWWNEAFEAAGFRNAYRVEMLPPGADPMDIRYNIIHWVHRSTRGWSYGGGVVDPRTGEIIKGNVNLGSLRVRQDYLLGSGLISLFDDPQTVRDFEYLSGLDASINSAQMALARIRQLAAHEVGHTLGFAHNFAASVNDRASVMDYPAPLVQINNGTLDLSEAYDVGIGEWDKIAARYAYSEFPDGSNEKAKLEEILEEARRLGLHYITDSDARPSGAAHPLANLWDNGSDPVAALDHTIRVREIALRKFGPQNLEPGSALSLLEARLLPLYLHHRYQTEAAVKSVGGVLYDYSVRNSRKAGYEVLPSAVQKRALETVLRTSSIDFLRLSPDLLEMIPPPAWTFQGPSIELFEGRMSPILDPLAAAQVAADFGVSGLLQPQRAARLVAFSATRDNLGFDDVLDSLVRQSWQRGSDEYDAAIGRSVQHLIVTRLIELTSNTDADITVRSLARSALDGIATNASSPKKADTEELAFQGMIAGEIQRFLQRTWTESDWTKPLDAPPGSPIGN